MKLKSLLGSLDLNRACGREVWSSRECLNVFSSSTEWLIGLERSGGPFIASQWNLAIGVSEIRTYSGRGPDMSSNRLGNPAYGPDMSSHWDLTRDKAKRPDLSGLGAGHVWEWLLEPRSVRPKT
jgi:hypothetical protein